MFPLMRKKLEEGRLNSDGLGSQKTLRSSRKSLRSLILILVCLAFLVVGCSEGDGGASMMEANAAIEVDPLFREFYAHLGGLETLGPAISPLFPYGSRKYQYTQSALLVHDPEAPASQRFGLAPLAHDMGIGEPPVPPPAQQGARYVEGHIIYDEFVAFFDQLGGTRFVGRPLTEMHINSEKRRYEQYFENLGFYRLENDLPGTVRLLAYGAWKCDTSCRRTQLNNNEVILPALVGPSFVEAVNRLGTNFTGFAISAPYLAADGSQEQIFENLVLFADNAQSGRILARPITSRLGYLPEALGSASPEPGMYFYPVQGDQGYNIPQAFLDYISQHGGIEITGAPISEALPVREGVLRQCYTNLCLEQHTSLNGNVNIRPTTLGYTYRAVAGQPAPQVPGLVQPTLIPTYPPTPLPTSAPELPPTGFPTAPPEALPTLADVLPAVPPEVTPEMIQPAPTAMTTLPTWTLQVWETFPTVSTVQSQEIGVSVLSNDLPQANIEPDLLLMLPNGEQRTYFMYPTGQDGVTYLVLDPIEAPSGTLIPYQVCILNSRGENFCVRDSFLIWEAP
jgi:hypothetical protein